MLLSLREVAGINYTSRFYCQPPRCSIGLSAAWPCCTLFRHRASVAQIT